MKQPDVLALPAFSADEFRPLQEYVAGERTKNVLLPRQAVWAVMLDHLAMAVPKRLETTYTKTALGPADYENSLMWEHQQVHVGSEQTIRIATNVRFAPTGQESGQKPESPEDATLNAALDYLHHRIRPRKKHLARLGFNPEAIEQKSYSKADVLGALTALALPRARSIDVGVEFIPWSQQFPARKGHALEPHALLGQWGDIEVLRADWETPADKTGALQYGNIAEAYEGLRAEECAANGNQASFREPFSMAEVEDWLQRTYVQPGVGGDFERLAEVTGLLDWSVPVYPKGDGRRFMHAPRPGR